MRWKIRNPTIREAEESLLMAKRFRAKFRSRWKDEIRRALLGYQRVLESMSWLFRSSLLVSTNLGNPKVMSLYSRLRSISSKVHDLILFFEAGLPKLESRDSAFRECPEFRNYLSRQFAFAPHSLPEEAEMVASRLLGPAWENWERMVEEFLHTDAEEGRTVQELLSAQMSRSKERREKATKLLNRILARHVKEAEHEINSILEAKMHMDEIRGFRHPEDRRFLADEVKREDVLEMISRVRRLFRLSKEFYAWKGEKIGGMKYSWRNVPVEREGKISESRMFSLARSILGRSGFAWALDYFLSGRLDLYPRKGKAGGAFCSAFGPKEDVYMLLNFTGRMEDFFALMHEIGHGIHYLLMRKQEFLNFGSSLAIAETCSTFFENLAMEEAGAGIRKAESDISSVFRQAAAFLFEAELHRKFRKSGYLPADEISGILEKWMRKYMGDVEMDMPNFWVIWNHFREPFYVYSYVFGHLLSLTLDISDLRQMMEAGRSVPLGKMVRKGFWRDGLRTVKMRIEEVIG